MEITDTAIEYRIREYYFKLKLKDRKIVKKRVCAALGIKTSAFYNQLSGIYDDMGGKTLLVWKAALNLESIDMLYPTDKGTTKDLRSFDS